MYIYIYTLLLLIFDQKYVLKYLDFLFPNRLCLAASESIKEGPFTRMRVATFRGMLLLEASQRWDSFTIYTPRAAFHYPAHCVTNIPITIFPKRKRSSLREAIREAKAVFFLIYIYIIYNYIERKKKAGL